MRKQNRSKRTEEQKKRDFEKALQACKANAESMTDKEKLDWIPCRNHTGKMQDIISMSSSSTVNPFCIARIEEAKQVFEETGKEIVCLHCFSESMQNQYDTMHAKYVVATEILTEKIYPVEDFPIVNAAIARIESFGDAIPKEFGGLNQCVNYIHYMKQNPETMFAWWTKNPEVLRKAFEIESKPDNCIVIYSDPMINGSMEDPEELLKALQIVYPFIDKLFIVYSPAYIKENAVDINCGARSCNKCRRCYRKSAENIIKEQLK